MLTVMEPGGLTQAMVLFATAEPVLGMLPVTVAASTVKVAVSVLGLGNGFAAMSSLL
jgi:hypothetical protein